jgi:protein-tyrosine phosphatase
MCGRGMLVHCPGGLGPAVTVLAAEIPCGNGVFTDWALEGAEAVHHFDRVMSHSFNYSRLSRYDFER